MRTKRWSRLESELRNLHGPRLAGMDEVGRGPLAGPVVACAVIMPPERRAIGGVADSKVLTEARRDALAVRIRAAALAVGVGAASVREIDTLNIYQATALAMRRAVRRLGFPPDHLVIDGKPIKPLGLVHTAVVDGDAICYSIACASIIAKVTRDRLMRSLAARYPRYAWERNVGYGTPEHIEAMDVWGATPHHRTSFRIKQLELEL